MIVRLIIWMVLTASVSHAADRILGTTNGVGTLEQLTGSEAAAIIGATTGSGITSAINEGSAYPIGDGTHYLKLWGDSTYGYKAKPNPLGDTVIRCWTNYNCVMHDEENNRDLLIIDSDAASPNAMFQVPVGLTYSIPWDASSITVDGTNCTAATDQALNSAEKTAAFSCADSNSSIFSGKVRMPGKYDGGTVTFTLTLFHGTTESITFAGDFSAQCRGAGTALNSTYGTAQSADVSITTANNIVEQTSAAVTPNGSCGGGKWLFWRYVVDSANYSTNAANSKVLGVTMHYNATSLSN